MGLVRAIIGSRPPGARRVLSLSAVLCALTLLGTLIIAPPAEAASPGIGALSRSPMPTGLQQLGGSQPYDWAWSGTGFPYNWGSQPDRVATGPRPGGSTQTVFAEQVNPGSSSGPYYRINDVWMNAVGKVERALHTPPLPAGWTPQAFYVAPNGTVFALVTPPDIYFLGGLPDPTPPNSNDHWLDTKVRGYVIQYSWTLQQRTKVPILGATQSEGVYQIYPTNTSMLLVGSTLYLDTSMFIYHLNNDVYDHHETNLALAIDLTSGSVLDLHDAYNVDASHSFAGFASCGRGQLLFAAHSDGGPRGLSIAGIPGAGQGADGCPTTLAPVDETNGAPTRLTRTWAIPGDMANPTDDDTYTTLNGFVGTSVGALSVGVSAPHQFAVHGITDSGHNSKLMPNVYVASTDLGSGATTLRWLTTFLPTSPDALAYQPRVTPIGNDQYAVMFSTTQGRDAARSPGSGTPRFRVVVIDARGHVLASRAWSVLLTPLTAPVRAGNTLTFLSQAGNGRIEFDRIPIAAGG